MLKKLKVGSKLIGGFLLVALLTGLMGAFAVFKLKGVDQENTAGWMSSVQSMTAFMDLSTSFQRPRVDIRDVVSAATAEDRRKALEKTTERRKEFAAAVELLNKVEMTDEQKRVFAEVKRKWEDYTAVADRAISLAEEGKDKAAQDLLKENSATAATLGQQVTELGG